MSRKKVASKKSREEKKTSKRKPTVKAAGKKEKKKSLSDFRYPKAKPEDTRISHPRYIYKKSGNKYTGLSITHDEKGSNRSKTKPLEKNPNPNDSRPARISKKAEEFLDKDLGPRLKGWRFWSRKDKEIVLKIIEENNKKEHKKRNGG